ncbi:30S ribosomal protein S4 [Candidatus Kaiserbacteria bacterium CG_4_8_14_3_um_filter_38_9]|uniref:Small ribosomal subunit protein uS4 n=1 Tax=Candidatus Kaiserbacteria bacterium CG_4_8_14_3_um_filter_38_9 TaxID=1974599 RepID=A0A2M7IP79_9BACT|nr:30S ribosomal protein S4 [Candidatus Kaiserbacteria bacterium]PIW97166.1 MAG: 30S ribosomal protein S4 [Candidatus Kaiserbacteria bacterium CG_4_8_14_3_um_filter_38_9]
MIIGPKYKIAKRLGAPIFEKTQSPKFALSEARKGRNRKHGGMASDYKKQLIEKQKMRFTYGISEKQLSRYVKDATEKSNQPITILMERLEYRLDNIVYRLGLAKTRRFARQMVNHGHIFVNGRRLDIPSHKVSINDTISVREQSKAKGMYTFLADTHESVSVPSWLSFDLKSLSGNVLGSPVYQATDFMFDPELVLEYYSR